MQPEFKNIPLNRIHVASNYRKTFNDKSITELARSIKANGVLEPIIVRPNRRGFEIVAGERRFRAAQIAGLVTIPAVVRNTTDAEVLTLQIIKNVQREGVPFMEEAFGLKKLRDDLTLDVREIAAMIGKSETYVYMQLKLTAMSDDAQTIAKNGWISKGVAWEIAKLPNTDYQTQAAKDLARTKSSNLITASRARFYINETFGNGRGRRRRRSDRPKIYGNDFAENWKHYLVNFTCDQFEQFKSIVRGRTDTSVLSEAVEIVMRAG